MKMDIVLVPGFMLDEDLWCDVVEGLEAFGSVVHADLSNAASIESMASETLGKAPDRFTLIGFSMGGYVARAMQRLAPERVEKMVLIATSARGDTKEEARRKMVAAHAVSSSFRGLNPASIKKSLAEEKQEDKELLESEPVP